MSAHEMREPKIIERRRGDRVYLYERYWDEERKRMRERYLGPKETVAITVAKPQPIIVSKEEMEKVKPRPIHIPKREYHPDYIPTSSEALNYLMYGWQKGTINVIYGEARTLKSSLIMDAIIHAYDKKNPNQVFLILDTEGFPMGRLEEMVSTRRLDHEIIERTKVCRATDFNDQHQFIVHMWKDMIREHGWKPSIIAVDSIISFYHEELCKVPRTAFLPKLQEVQRKLTLQLSYLHRMAMNFNVPAIVTNWPKSEMGRALRDRIEEFDISTYRIGPAVGFVDFSMLGGRRLEYISKLILRTFRAREDATVGILVKHLRRPTDRFTWFGVNKAGICDVRKYLTREVALPLSALELIVEAMKKEEKKAKRRVEEERLEI